MRWKDLSWRKQLETVKMEWITARTDGDAPQTEGEPHVIDTADITLTASSPKPEEKSGENAPTPMTLNRNPISSRDDRGKSKVTPVGSSVGKSKGKDKDETLDSTAADDATWDSSGSEESEDDF